MGWSVPHSRSRILDKYNTVTVFFSTSFMNPFSSSGCTVVLFSYIMRLLLFLVILAYSVSAAVIYVQSGNVAAVTSAINSGDTHIGDTVVMNPGVYTGCINYGIRLNKRIILNGTGAVVDCGDNGNIYFSGVSTYPGSDGVVVNHLTIINANEGVRHTQVSNITLYNVTLTSNTLGVKSYTGDLGAQTGYLVMLNCTITNSTKSGLYAGDGNVHIVNSYITGNGNEVLIYGGGVSIQKAHVVIENTVISGNTAQNGAGISMSGNYKMTIYNSTVMYNTGKYAGGLHAASGGDVDMYDTHLIYNKVQYYGGAMYFDNAQVVATRCTFDNNDADIGGAVYGVDTFTTFYAYFCTFNNNTAISAAGIHVTGGRYEFHDTELSYNYANGTLKGGAVYAQSSNAVVILRRNRIIANRATQGAGLYAVSEGSICTKYRYVLHSWNRSLRFQDSQQHRSYVRRSFALQRLHQDV